MKDFQDGILWPSCILRELFGCMVWSLGYRGLQNRTMERQRNKRDKKWRLELHAGFWGLLSVWEPVSGKVQGMTG